MKHTLLILSLGAAIATGATVSAGERTGHRMGAHHGFEELDANGDGKLVPEEMQGHMQARFEGADADGDGMLSSAELEAHIRAGMEERVAAYAAHMLERHDADEDGALSPDEMKPRDGDRMFSRMDADGDGAVSRAEFDEMRGKHGKHGKRGHGEHGKHGMQGQDGAAPAEGSDDASGN